MELDYYVPTGLMIKEYLDMNQMSVSQLAEKLDVTESLMNKVLESSMPLTDDMAEEISKIFNIESKYFLEYEHSYRDFLKKQK